MSDLNTKHSALELRFFYFGSDACGEAFRHGGQALAGGGWRRDGLAVDFLGNGKSDTLFAKIRLAIGGVFVNTGSL